MLPKIPHEQPQDSIFDGLELIDREDTMEALYRAGRVRDEVGVDAWLDAHREAHGDPEQVAYANRAVHRQDDVDLGQFPYHGDNHTWSPSPADADRLAPNQRIDEAMSRLQSRSR